MTNKINCTEQEALETAAMLKAEIDDIKGQIEVERIAAMQGEIIDLDWMNRANVAITFKKKERAKYIAHAMSLAKERSAANEARKQSVKKNNIARANSQEQRKCGELIKFIKYRAPDLYPDAMSMLRAIEAEFRGNAEAAE